MVYYCFTPIKHHKTNQKTSPPSPKAAHLARAARRLHRSQRTSGLWASPRVGATRSDGRNPPGSGCLLGILHLENLEKFGKNQEFTGKIYGDFTWISLDVFIFFRFKGWNYCKRISWDLTPFLHGCQVCGDGKLLRSFWEHFLGWYFYIDLEMLGGFWNMDWLLDWRIVGETTMQFGSFQIDDSDSRSLLLHRNCLWTFALSYGEHAEPVMMGLLGSSASFFEGTRLQGPSKKKRTPGEIVTCHTPSLTSLTGWSWSTVLTAGWLQTPRFYWKKLGKHLQVAWSYQTCGDWKWWKFMTWEPLDLI